MPVLMFKFNESDLEYLKDILVDAFRDCIIKFEDREEKGIKLKDDLDPKDFYAFMAIFMQNRIDWGR